MSENLKFLQGEAVRVARGYHRPLNRIIFEFNDRIDGITSATVEKLELLKADYATEKTSVTPASFGAIDREYRAISAARILQDIDIQGLASLSRSRFDEGASVAQNKITSPERTGVWIGNNCAQGVGALGAPLRIGGTTGLMAFDGIV